MIYTCEPMSRKSIRNMCIYIRKLFGYSVNSKVNVLRFMEIALPKLIKEFSYMVVPDKDMDNCYAYTDITDNTIYISASTYDGALVFNPRDVFTIALEIGHLVLHRETRVKYARQDKPKAYVDPEWQAYTFAAEFLCPSGSNLGCHQINDIATMYGVSREVASIQVQYE